MLSAVMASVNYRDSQVNEFVEFAIERASHTRVEAQKILQHLRTMRQSLLRIARLTPKRLLINLEHLRRGVFRVDQANAAHQVLQGSSCVHSSCQIGPFLPS